MTTIATKTLAKGKKEKAADWHADLDDFAATAKQTVFKPRTGLFRFSTAGKGTGQSLAVVVNAKIREDGYPARRVLLRIPEQMNERLKDQVSGPVTVALVALAEWALEQLEERREILVIDNQ